MNDLITLDDIADLYHVTRRYARDVLVKRPEFPTPARGSTHRKPVWVREHVIDYARGEEQPA